MQFKACANTFDAIEVTQSRNEITKLLASLFSQLQPEELAIMCNITLGQLHAPYIGTQFALATKTMVKIIAQYLGVSEETINQQLNDKGDLGDVIASYNWQATKQPSIQQVYDALCTIEKISGTGSQEEKGQAVSILLQQVTPQEAKFIVRMILGKLRLGFSDMTLLDSLSWMAAGDKSLSTILEDAYNLCADIGRIAALFKQEGVQGLRNLAITVGIPIRPSAAERLPTAADIVQKLGPCVAQPKLDGFRLQIHVDKRGPKPVVHFYSRNLQDMSAMFPDLVHEFSALPIETLICEGEAITYDQNTGTFLPFQETVKRKRKHGVEDFATDMPLKLFLFDILYLNGESCLNNTHEQRRAKLEHCVQSAKTDAVQVIEERSIATAQELQDYFDEMIALGLEGLVVKRPDAIYKAGKRNFNWIKLKRHAEGHIEDSIDCVVLGYYRGQGRRSSFGIGALLVGVYNKAQDKFETIAKIGTGFTDDEWREIKQQCDAIALPTQPASVICHKNLIPDVWVDPQIVIQIFADEITLSPAHTAGKTEGLPGYALRFPRFMGYRPDKGPLEATTTNEIITLHTHQYKK